MGKSSSKQKNRVKRVLIVKWWFEIITLSLINHSMTGLANVRAGLMISLRPITRRPIRIITVTLRFQCCIGQLKIFSLVYRGVGLTRTVLICTGFREKNLICVF